MTEPAQLLDGSLSPAARRFAQAHLACSTRLAYGKDWNRFAAWCLRGGLGSLPAAPEVVANYAAEQALRLRPATVDRRLAAIADRHREAGLPSPTSDPLIGRLVRGMRRELGSAPRHQAQPLSGDQIGAVLACLPAGLGGQRDQALLLLGLAGGFRRSELCGLNLEDLVFGPDEILLRLRSSKTDVEGWGRQVGIARLGGGACPVAAVEGWVLASKIRGGALLRTVDRHGNLGSRLRPAAVARIVKRAVARAGIDAQDYSGHSLRTTLVTLALGAGSDLASLMAVTGHRSAATLIGYDRRAARTRMLTMAVLGSVEPLHAV